MCFHNSLSKKAREVANRFRVQTEIDFGPVYYASGFSFPQWPVITAEEPDRMKPFRWGLIPHWVKDQAQARELRAMTLNAKSETVFEKPSFRFSIHKKRCLVPSTGFYEWQDYNKKKYPYFIGLKKTEIFALAGIYTHWTDKESGEIAATFSILTTSANPLLARIHNMKKRMPVILLPEKESDWLNEDLTDDQIRSFFPAIDDRLMHAHTISKLITSRTRNPNVPEVTEAFSYPELPVEN
jgi:putative SOS response-associated peptidase YedK